MKEFRYSEEQLAIINDDEHNIIVNAVAGSGKTTTIAGICKRNVGKQILVLTYSRRLMEETKSKIGDIDGVEIYTFHNFVKKWGNLVGSVKDIEMERVLNGNTELCTLNYEIIIVDEVQDMYFMVYKLVRTILAFSVTDNRLVVLGDFKQNIFSSLNQSDSRFLIFSDRIFGINREWKRYSLSTSYRCPDIICEFMRIGKNPVAMHSYNKKGGRMSLIEHYGTDGYLDDLISRLMILFKRGVGGENIFIILPSTKTESESIADRYGNREDEKKKGASVKIANRIKDVFGDNYCVIITGVGGDISKIEYNNKIVISTIHKTKGLERDYVFLCNFDTSYLKFFTKQYDSDMPNTLYVAITRAKKELVLYKSFSEASLPFINEPQSKILGCGLYHGKSLMISDKINSSGVTDFIDGLPSNVVIEIERVIKVVSTKIGDEISIQTHTTRSIRNKPITENISMINGKYVERLFDLPAKITVHELDKIYKECVKDSFAVLRYPAMQMGKFRPSAETINRIKENCYRLSESETDLGFPIKKQEKVRFNLGIRPLIGIVDFVYENHIVELKLVTDVTVSHILQLLLYSYAYGFQKKAILFNIKSGTKYTVLNPEECVKIIETMDKNRGVDCSDEEFIEKCTGMEIRSPP